MESSLSSWKEGSLDQIAGGTFILHDMGALSEYIRPYVSLPRGGLPFIKTDLILRCIL